MSNRLTQNEDFLIQHPTQTTRIISIDENEDSNSKYANPNGVEAFREFKERHESAQQLIKPTAAIFNEQNINTNPEKYAPRAFQLADGRTVIVREPRGNVRFRAANLIPTNKSGNDNLVSMVQSSLYVTQVGEKKFPPPQTFLEAQSILDELEDEGFMLLQLKLEDFYPLHDTTKDEIKKRQAANL